MGPLRQWDSRDYLAAGVFLLIGALCLSPLVAIGTAAGSVSLETAFSDDAVVLFLRSVGYAAGVSLAATLLGLGLAYLLVRTDLKGRGYWLAGFVLPIFIPSYIHALSWSRALPSLTGGLASVGVQTLSYYPVALLLIAIGLRQWARPFQEAAGLYAAPAARWWLLEWPYLRGYVLLSGFLVFFLAFADFGVPDLFQIRVYATEVFIQLSAYLDSGAAVLASLPVLVMGMTFLSVVIRLLRRHQIGVSREQNRPVAAQRLGGYQAPAQLALAGAFGALVAYPLVHLAGLVGEASVLGRAVVLAWTDAFAGVGLTLLATCLAVALGLVMTYGISRRHGLGREWLRMLPLLWLILPAAVLGLGNISLWNQPGPLGAFHRTGGVLILSLAVLALPIAVEGLRIGWRKLPLGQEEAGYLAGCAPRRVAWDILLPLLKGPLLIVGIIVFIYLFNNLSLYVLLAPAGVSTLPLRIFSTVHYGPDTLVAAMCLFQVLILALPAAIALGLGRRFFQGGR